MDDRNTSRKQDDMDTVTTPMDEWNRLPWKPMQRQVFRLQKRIYQASQRGDVKAVHKLQRLLMQSWSARCLAVRKVTQDNRGKKTAGVDGVKSLKPPERLLLARLMRCPRKRDRRDGCGYPSPARRTSADWGYQHAIASCASARKARIGTGMGGPLRAEQLRVPTRPLMP